MIVIMDVRSHLVKMQREPMMNQSYMWLYTCTYKHVTHAINFCTDTSSDLWSFPLLGLDLVTEGAGVRHAGEAAAGM